MPSACRLVGALARYRRHRRRLLRPIRSSRRCTRAAHRARAALARRRRLQRHRRSRTGRFPRTPRRERTDRSRHRAARADARTELWPSACRRLPRKHRPSTRWCPRRRQWLRRGQHCRQQPARRQRFPHARKQRCGVQTRGKHHRLLWTKQQLPRKRKRPRQQLRPKRRQITRRSQGCKLSRQPPRSSKPPSSKQLQPLRQWRRRKQRWRSGSSKGLLKRKRALTRKQMPRQRLRQRQRRWRRRWRRRQRRRRQQQQQQQQQQRLCKQRRSCGAKRNKRSLAGQTDRPQLLPWLQPPPRLGQIARQRQPPKLLLPPRRPQRKLQRRNSRGRSAGHWLRRYPRARQAWRFPPPSQPSLPLRPGQML